jgi:Fe-Mn family superoxide dismutase
MDKYNLGRRSFLQGLAGTALLFTGLSRVSAKEPTAKIAKAEPKVSVSDIQKYKGLIGALRGFSATIVREHLALLERYRHKLAQLESQDRMVDLSLADPISSKWRNHVLTLVEVQNSVRLHELYFDALTPRKNEPGQNIIQAMEKSYGSFDQWWIKFRATAMAVRSWGALGWDKQSKQLVTFGLDNDSEWLIGVEPLLVVDMAEHAYVLDFIGQPLAYLNAWKEAVDWGVVESRLAEALRK